MDCIGEVPFWSGTCDNHAAVKMNGSAVSGMPPIRDSRPSVRIRMATPADVLIAIPVVNAAYAIETFLDGTRTDETRMAEMLKKGEFLVAAEDDAGRIVASVYTEKRGQRGYFGMLAVEPSQQGSGLGRRMIEAAEEHCRVYGCKHMDIVVLSLRPELPPFYRRLGYTETGTEEFHPSRLRAEPSATGSSCQRRCDAAERTRNYRQYLSVRSFAFPAATVCH